jgi:hypothetical protein
MEILKESLNRTCLSFFNGIRLSIISNLFEALHYSVDPRIGPINAFASAEVARWPR